MRLNHWWTLYLEEYYHKDPHEGIAEYYRSLGSTVPAEGITLFRNGTGTAGR